jgi:hypothetical protein
MLWWLSRLATGLSPRRPGFSPGVSLCEALVEGLLLREFSASTSVCPVSIIRSVLSVSFGLSCQYHSVCHCQYHSVCHCQYHSVCHCQYHSVCPVSIIPPSPLTASTVPDTQTFPESDSRPDIWQRLAEEHFMSF